MVTGTRRGQIAFAGALTILALAVLAMHVVRLPEPLGIDQGLFACFARWVPRGWLPYRDIFDSKPPLFRRQVAGKGGLDDFASRLK